MNSVGWRPGYKRFIEDFFQIIDKERNIVDFRLNDIQDKFVTQDSSGTKDVILKARQQGFCLDPDTPVLLENLTWKKIKNIAPGDEVVAVDEKDQKGRGNIRKLKTTTVEAIRFTNQEAFKIKMESGKELIATGEHRFLTLSPSGSRGGWRRVSKIKPGYSIRFITDTWGEQTIEDSWIGGVIDSEAHFRRKKSGGVELAISQVDGLVWKKIKSWADKNNLNYRIDWDTRDHRKNKPVGSIIFNRMNEMFKIIGKTRPVRHVSKRWWEEKGLPGKRTGEAWDKIASIEPVGKRTMVDLQTGCKTFIANGYISHNSSVILALFTVDFLIKPNSRNIIVADEKENAEEMLEKVKFYIESYEYKMNKKTPGFKVPLKYSSKYELYNEFTKSRYTIGTALKTEFGRSKTITNLHLSEAAFYRNMEKLLAGAMQAVVPNGRTIIETTANGFNYFKNFWDRSVNDETGFNAIFYKASDFYGPELLEQKKKELGRQYVQEYPETDIEAFITSGECFFSGEALEWYKNNLIKPGKYNLT